MATGPIDYASSLQAPNFGQNIAQGLQLGQVFQQRQLDIEKKRAAAESAQQYQADLQEVASNPTAQGFSNLTLKYPQQHEAIKQAWEQQDEGQKKSQGEAALQTLFALNTGNADVAKKVVQARITALDNTGQDSSHEKLILGAIDTHPEDVKRELLQWATFTQDPTKLAENLGKIGAEQRAQGLAPAELRSATAKAAGEEADATTKGVTANYAEKNAKIGLEQKGLELGLTRAQTKQALAGAANLSASAQQTVLEMAQLKATGGIPPKEKFEQEQKLRNEYHAQTKPFTDMKEAVGRITASEQTGPGDITMVYSFMKVLDPTSVVREGEFATAQNSAGVPEAVRALANKVANGQRLTPKQRADFVSQSRALMNKAGVREKEVRSGIDKIAGSYGLNKQNIYFNDHTVDSAPPSGNDVLSAADAILAGRK